ncbi:hypothetical protein C8Q76DRAFT_698392 [Earliella scabrosa]|nr:hypothetical protein C8Q76DRAFT_698392 [Earliella scabrosa]
MLLVRNQQARLVLGPILERGSRGCQQPHTPESTSRPSVDLVPIEHADGCMCKRIERGAHSQANVLTIKSLMLPATGPAQVPMDSSEIAAITMPYSIATLPLIKLLARTRSSSACRPDETIVPQLHKSTSHVSSKGAELKWNVYMPSLTHIAIPNQRLAAERRCKTDTAVILDANRLLHICSLGGGLHCCSVERRWASAPGGIGRDR